MLFTIFYREGTEDMKKETKIKYTVRINNPSVLEFLKKDAEQETRKRGEITSTNQLVNEILEDYIARGCTQTNFILMKFNERIENLENNMKQLIELQVVTNQLLSDLINELRF